MTRLIFFPDEAACLFLDDERPPAELVEAINTGDYQPPFPSLATQPWRAARLGGVVIAAPSLWSGPILPHGSRLSTRERQVLQGLADGLTDKEISLRLGMSRRMVSTYVERIKKRLGVRTREQSVGIGVALGLCTVEWKE